MKGSGSSILVHREWMSVLMTAPTIRQKGAWAVVGPVITSLNDFNSKYCNYITFPGTSLQDKEPLAQNKHIYLPFPALDMTEYALFSAENIQYCSRLLWAQCIH